MTDMISTPSKPPRARHQHSKSATPVAFHSNGYEVSNLNPANSTQRRPRRNRSNFDHSQGLAGAQSFAILSHGNGQHQHHAGQRSPISASKTRDGETGSDSGTNGPSARDRQPRQRDGKQNGRDSRTPFKGVQNRSQPISVIGPGPAFTPVKSQAYAGPGFHASPLPSALPIPTKFLSKSVPETKTSQSLDARIDNGPSGSSSPPTSSSPLAGSSPPISESSDDQVERRQHEPSPLDIFFQADRAEKAKRSNAVPSPEVKVVPGVAVSKSTDAGTSINSHPQSKPFHTRHASNDKGLFVMELDASANPSGPSSSPPTQPGVDLSRREAVNQSLKDMLFSLADRKTTLSSPISHNFGTPSEPSSRFHSPSPLHPNSAPRSHSGPATPISYDAEMPSHYGNRNLSPLFHAAKGKEPNTRRSSNLRKEITHAAPSPFDSPQRPPQVSSIKSRVPSVHTSLNSSHSSGAFPYQHNSSGVSSAPSLTSPQRASPAVSPSPSRFQIFNPTSALDVKAMEDDLRRILNLNVLGSPATAPRI